MIGGLRARLGRVLYGSRAYDWTLAGRVPNALAAAPLQPWAGEAQRGGVILKGSIELDGETHGAGPDLWRDPALSEAARTALHGFRWLTDLHAVGSDTARRRAREMVAEWIAGHPRWDESVWRPDILSARVTAWIAEYEFFCASADDAFRRAYFRALTRQVRHLFRAAPGATKGVARLAVAKALVYGAVALPGPADRLNRALRMLDQEIGRQVLPDGAHIERNAQSQLQALRILADVRACLTAGRLEIPTILQTTIDRMAPALRALRHADGGFALFNGAGEGEPWLADAVLAQSEATGRAPDELRHGGFQRMRAGRTLIIADAGAPAPSGYDGTAHAGALSFEMAVGKERLVVNCGARPRGSAGWTAAQRATAAHSTLVVAETNSSEIAADGGLGQRVRRVDCRRDIADGAVLVEMAHDGYREGFGAVHRRRLYLSADGYDLRGEDSIAGDRPVPVTLRFHLHPEVSVSLTGGGDSALLRLPSGEGWRFRAAGGKTDVAESIYLGGRDGARRTEQIVVTGELAPGGAIKWALRRLDS